MTDREIFLKAIEGLSSEDVVSMLPKEVLEKIKSTQKNTPHMRPSNMETPQGETATTPKKPVNAFMAFRSYYSKAFPNVSQKNISSLVRTLWQNDLFHAEWQIMAQVYSFVRDANLVHSSKYDITIFLCPAVIAMGVPPVGEYVAANCWNIFQNAEGVMSLQRVTAPTKAQLRITYQPIANSQVSLLDWMANSDHFEGKGKLLVQCMKDRPEIFLSTPPVTVTPNIPHLAAQIRDSPINTAAAMMNVGPDHPSLGLGVGYLTAPNLSVLGMGEQHRSATTAVPNPSVQTRTTRLNPGIIHTEQIGPTNPFMAANEPVVNMASAVPLRFSTTHRGEGNDAANGTNGGCDQVL